MSPLTNYKNLFVIFKCLGRGNFWKQIEIHSNLRYTYIPVYLNVEYDVESLINPRNVFIFSQKSYYGEVFHRNINFLTAPSCFRQSSACADKQHLCWLQGVPFI